MKDRIPNILRAGVILMVLTVWMPTAATLVFPHNNSWVEGVLNTADVRAMCANGSRQTYSSYGSCKTSFYRSRFEWDGWMIYGPITFGLLAGLYFVSGSLSLRPRRLED